MAITTPRHLHSLSRRSTSRRPSRRTLDPHALLSADDRALRRRVLAAALSRGQSLHPDAVTVVIATKRWRPEPFEFFSEETVAELLWIDMLSWCEAMDADLPLDAGAALWHLLVLLAGTAQLTPQSDDIECLLESVESQGGLTKPKRRRKPQ